MFLPFEVSELKRKLPVDVSKLHRSPRFQQTNEGYKHYRLEGTTRKCGRAASKQVTVQGAMILPEDVRNLIPNAILRDWGWNMEHLLVRCPRPCSCRNVLRLFPMTMKINLCSSLVLVHDEIFCLGFYGTSQTIIAPLSRTLSCQSLDSMLFISVFGELCLDSFLSTLSHLVHSRSHHWSSPISVSEHPMLKGILPACCVITLCIIICFIFTYILPNDNKKLECVAGTLEVLMLLTNGTQLETKLRRAPIQLFVYKKQKKKPLTWPSLRTLPLVDWTNLTSSLQLGPLEAF